MVNVLDALGKWSLVDMYVLCIMTVSFPTVVKILGYTIDVFVEVRACVRTVFCRDLWRALGEERLTGERAGRGG